MVNTLLYVSYLLICISSNYLSLLYTMELAITTKKMNFLTIFLDKMLLKAEATVDLYTFLETGLDLF